MLDYDSRWTEGTPMDDEDEEYTSRCVACGNPIDYCPGHGEIGDPSGNGILEQHDAGDHSECHPDGCDDAKTD